jgi:hypothetical protein
MLLYLKDRKDHQNTHRSDKYFHKAAEPKVNVQKTIAFVYTNNKFDEKETRNIISSKVVSPGRPLKNT